MCGIAGVFSALSLDSGKLSKDITKMVRTLHHRGPDDEGIWVEPKGRLVLGHCRLSIIDLSSEGHQPMASSTGRYIISFNGEIYNFLELKIELKNLGVHFRGKSDTEVLLAALESWGLAGALPRFVGMFAFAVWDRAENQLFLARDRVGKKPLYYYNDGRVFYFASEIKAFRNLDTIILSIHEESIYHYLSLGFIPSPDTIYKEIKEVQPGCSMGVDSELHQTDHSYWTFAQEPKCSISFSDAVEQVNQCLTEAVKIRLRADVSVGAFLSGGIDSGLLTAIASLNSDKPIKTFTVGFDGGSFDETPLAGAVSQRYGTEHHVIRVSPKLDEILPRVVRAYDEPFADPSAVPTFAVARAASQYVKVVLNGEGGDELFGGYRRHLSVWYYSRSSRVIHLLPDSSWRGFNRLLPIPRSQRSSYAFLYRFLRGISRNPYKRYIVWSSDGFDEEEKNSLLKSTRREFQTTPEFLSKRYSWLNGGDPLSHFMSLDFVLGMSDCLLVKMDIATMAYGLEARCPFLDHRLVDWTTSLPPEVLLSGKTTKPILRELAKRYLPRQLVMAPKRGFEIPLIKWMREDLFDMTRDHCLSSHGIVLDLFDRQKVEDLLYRKSELDEDHRSKQLWILLMLSLWHHYSK